MKPPLWAGASLVATRGIELPTRKFCSAICSIGYVKSKSTQQSTEYDGQKWLKGASSGDGPVGRSRERFPAAPARNRPRGRLPPPFSLPASPGERSAGGGEKYRGGAPRGETSRSKG